MFCPDCGHELSSETAKFCFKCGSAMPTAAVTAAAVPVPPTGAVAPGIGTEPFGKPKRSKVGPVVGITFGIIAAIVSFFAVRTFLGGAPTLEEFASGDGVTFHEPSGRFSVTFPADPEERRQSAPLPDGTQLDTVMYYVDEEPEYVFLAGYTDLGGRPFDLNAAAQGAAAGAGGTITGQSPRTVGGVSGQEIHMSVVGTTATMWIGAAGDNLYQLQAIGVPDGHAGIARFFDSFQPAA